MDFETQVAVARIEAAEARNAELNRLMDGVVKDGNKPNGLFIETVEMSLAWYTANDARLALNAVYDDVRVAPDFPPQHVLNVLNRRFQVTEIEDWCEQLRAKGGPRVKPGWLRDQVTWGLVHKDRPLDPKVLQAAVLMDADRPVSRVKSGLLAA